jgi:hypothetical protein
MIEYSGYGNALKLAREALAALDPGETASRTGIAWNGETYEIPWLGKKTRLEDGSLEEQIIWSHYLAARGPAKPRGVYVTFKQTRGAAIYDANFTKRNINPMVSAFHNQLNDFTRIGHAMGGEAKKIGHASFTISALPLIPLTFVIWQGDDEVPASGNILFDETAGDWLCAEDLVVLAGLAVHKMLRELKK